MFSSSSTVPPFSHDHARPLSLPHADQPGFAPPPLSTAPVGIFVSGTKVQVGSHRVVIERYLSEGGFAHVYLVRLPQPVDGENVAVLKRVAVPDKEALTNMRTEVETMKKLKGHKQIVRYIDSHASQLKGGGFEVFLLMEYCNGGGLIDFMNTRLQDRLTEPEIVNIISDVAQGVACMHYLKPPLLHRDLKVENILIARQGSAKQFKLCDFGSTAPPRPAATNAAEGRLIEDDVQRHTTMQYRSPEMIDVYRKQPIDEKSDIWALGVLLYKLCYYTTPFEERGQMAILNASFKFPGYPKFTDKLKTLIAMMLQENPKSRPNIYQVIEEICAMQGIPVPIKNIYATRAASKARRDQTLPPTPSVAASSSSVGAYKAFPIEEKQSIPDITPMRRGRPTNLVAEQSSAKPSPSPHQSSGADPFAALDGSKAVPPDTDEIAQRFPSLDQFSLLHDAGSKFAFEPKPKPVVSQPAQPKELSQRVTEALADDAFVQLPRSDSEPQLKLQSQQQPIKAYTLNSKPSPNVDTTSHKSVAGLIQSMNAGTQTDPSSPKITKKPPTSSTGTMTSPQLLNHLPIDKSSIPSRPVYKFPSDASQNSPSQPRTAFTVAVIQDSINQDLPSRIQLDQSAAPQKSIFRSLQTPHTARPSLDSLEHQSSQEDILTRSKSETSRHRPLSAQFDTTKFSSLRSSSTGRGNESSGEQGSEDGAISSNVEFLKKMEEEEPSKKKEKRQSSGSRYSKLSLSGTKNLFSGRFGDAFKRFEGGQPGEEDVQNNLTPIAGSVATDGRSDDGQATEETEEMPPEMRRELERRRLSQEERRVAEAAAAYKQRVSENGPVKARDSTRASLIQHKVQSLLEESNKSPTKTAEGYGRFTNSAPPDAPSLVPGNPDTQKPVRQKPAFLSEKSAPAMNQPSPTLAARPSAPPKPQTLRTGGGTSSSISSPNVAAKPEHLTSRLRQDDSTSMQPNILSPEDWEAQFSKRYPSLSGLEMVETEISSDGRIIRDV